MNKFEDILEEKDTYDIQSRISNIFLQKQPQCERVILSDWSGTIHILRFQGQRLQKMLTKKLCDSPILGMDENRSKESSDELFLGTGDGKLLCFDAKTQTITNIGEDPDKRPIVKIISTGTRLFTFTWKKAMLYWDVIKKECTYKDTLTENFIAAEFADSFIIILFGNNSIAFLNVDTYRKGSPLRYKKIGYEELTKSISCFNKKIDNIALGDINGGVKILQRRKKENDAGFNMLSDKDQLTEDFDLIFVIKSHIIKMPLDQKLITVEFPVNAVEFKPKDPKTILSAGGDYSINMIKIETEYGKRVNKYVSRDSERIFTKPFTHLKFFADGINLLTAEINPDYYDITGKQEMKSTVRLLSLNDF